jgi:hypothetical protein
MPKLTAPPGGIERVRLSPDTRMEAPPVVLQLAP